MVYLGEVHDCMVAPSPSLPIHHREICSGNQKSEKWMVRWLR